MRKSYRTITLIAPPPVFARPIPLPRRSFSSYVLSVLAHGSGVGFLLALSQVPQLVLRDRVPQYTMRVYDSSEQDRPTLQYGGSGGEQTLPQVAANHLSVGGTPAPVAPSVPKLVQPIHQDQALLQPDAPLSLLVQPKDPIPTIFKWTPDNAPVQPVIESRFQKSILSKLKMSLDPPNHELKPSDIRMSASNMPSALQAIRPSTTSPIVVRADEPARPMPETASKPTQDPVPARILSLSDVRVQEGPVLIPLANAMGRPAESNSISPGRQVNPAIAGQGNSLSNQPGIGSGQATGSPGHDLATASGGGAKVGGNSAPGKNSGGGSDSGGRDAGTRIELPKDGQFGVVVVGSSLADQYPEIADMWNGRLFYTVYLHVGARKGWVMQYSLPPEAHLAASNGRPDAPWPYEMVRPHLEPRDFNSDGLIVHGFVNSAGRFERLAIVFPAEFTKPGLLLSALQQWQFRPARQNGKVAPVEVLLIIPEETE